ncbi:MAG: C40 family peptidase [Acidithiobacillus sp.]
MQKKKSRWHILLATAVLLGGGGIAQGATTHAGHSAHPRSHSGAQHHPHKAAERKVVYKKETRHTAARKRVAVRTAHPAVSRHEGRVRTSSLQPTDYPSGEDSAVAPANYDSLMPTALELMGMNPIEFAGVGAAPQQPEFRPYRIAPLPSRAVSVTAPSFIDQSLVLVKTGVAPIVPVPAASVASAEAAAPAAAIPAVAQAARSADPSQGTGAPASQLGLALEMLASQAYHWARHPLTALEASGDAAVGRQGVANLAADIAEAADAGGSSDGDGSWLSPRSLVRSALKFIGAPYRWGGMSPASGFDCSGFVKYVLAKFDIEVPRTSYAQAAVLPRIPRSDLKPGDLVFFNTMHRAYSHVGIYIGHGRFVSAQTPSSGVQVASLDNPYWAARFDGARRIPGSAHPS